MEQHIHQHLVRIEERLDVLTDAVCELIASNKDNKRLAKAAATLKTKTDALRAAVASVPNPPPVGASQ